MTYLLIFVLMSHQFESSPQSSVVAEFNSREACQAAAREVVRQVKANDHRKLQVLLCAAKGVKGDAK